MSKIIIRPEQQGDRGMWKPKNEEGQMWGGITYYNPTDAVSAVLFDVSEAISGLEVEEIVIEVQQN